MCSVRPPHPPLTRGGRYAMRDKIGEGAELGPYISSEDRATFAKMLEEVEEWLYSEEADEGTKVMSRHACTLYFPA